jgi:hypothetical protein
VVEDNTHGSVMAVVDLYSRGGFSSFCAYFFLNGLLNLFEIYDICTIISPLALKAETTNQKSAISKQTEIILPTSIMACMACKTVPKLITNLLVDEEISSKFTELTGIIINQNCFFCGKCVRKLENAIEFRRTCRAYYKEANEDYVDKEDPQYSIIESSHPAQEHEEIYVYEPIEYLEEEEDQDQEHDDGLMLEEESEECKPVFFEEHVIECNEKEEDEEEIIEDSNSNEMVEVDQEQFSTIVAAKGIRKRNSYTSAQKLEIVHMAEIIGNRKAARKYGTDESNVRKWRAAKEMLIDIDRDRGLKRKSNLHWPELDRALKKWVQQKMDEGIILKPLEIKKRSIELSNELNVSNFTGSSSYIFKFMDRYNIPSPRIRNPGGTKRRSEAQKQQQLQTERIVEHEHTID